MFTQEEFKVALTAFKSNGSKPIIYTYFKVANVALGSEDRQGLQSLWSFQDELKGLGHFYTPYESVEHLKRHFGDQLRQLRAQGRLG